MILYIPFILPPTRWHGDYTKRRFFCWKCLKVTQFFMCDNCGRQYCLGHCEWDFDSDGESFFSRTFEYPYHRECLS